MRNFQSGQRSLHPISYVGALVFGYLGITADAIYTAGVFLILGAELSRRSMVLGYAIFAFGVVWFLAMLGLDLGRDAALRDNARDNAPITAEP